MKTAVRTATNTTLSMSDINSSAISSFRFMGSDQVGTLEVTFQSGSVYRYFDVDYIKVLTMASWVNQGESLGSYFANHIRLEYHYSVVG